MARFNDTNTEGFDNDILDMMNQVYAWISDENPDPDYDGAHINAVICDQASYLGDWEIAVDLYEWVCAELGIEAIGV